MDTWMADIPGWYGPKHHYHHHHLKNVNFGGWPFGFWDRVLGMLSLFFLFWFQSNHTRKFFYTGTAHEETELDLKPLLASVRPRHVWFDTNCNSSINSTVHFTWNPFHFVSSCG